MKRLESVTGAPVVKAARREWLLPVTLALVVAIGLWMLWAFLLIKGVAWYWNVPLTVEKLGQLGDLFGGVNALFAGLAFTGVAVAAYYQYKTFRLLRSQHARESFEPLFLHLLAHVKRPESIRYRIPDSEATGPEEQPFNAAVRDFRRSFGHCLGSEGRWDLNDQQYSSALVRQYPDFLSPNESTLVPYLRSLYQLFALIERSEIDDDDKDYYAEVAAARLDKEDIFLLEVEAIVREQRLKPLIERFGLLREHLRHDPKAPVITLDEYLAQTEFELSAVWSLEWRKRHLGSDDERR